MIRALLDYYRLPAGLFDGISPTTDSASREEGFFQFGERNICYGRNQTGFSIDVAGSGQFDALKDIRIEGKTVRFPFDFTAVIENLRRERYRRNMNLGRQSFSSGKSVRKIYYLVREWLPVSVRRQLQQVYLRDWKELPFPSWPVDFTVDNLHQEFLRLLMKTSGTQKVPFIWFWPDGASSSLIMTHDVETSAGRDFTSKLIDLDASRGIRASYEVVPEERYEVPDDYVRQIRDRGCEFNVHDLSHDGQLYQKRDVFLERAKKINEYIRKFNARGFRAGVMYRNLDWYDAYDFSYDMSVPNVAHLEPQRGGCCTVMPFFVGNILELPLTTTQDYSLFYILNDHSIDLWKKQLDLIKHRNGLMSFISHPDYLINRRNRQVYETLLDYLRQMVAHENIWAALPGDVDRWWRARGQMKVVARGDNWEIVGPDKERARLAYAVLDGNRLRYEIAGAAKENVRG